MPIRIGVFENRVDYAGGDECWEWKGTKNDRGYGQYNSRGAHRVAWEINAARGVPDGMCVCHSCDNPGCVNPAHLWLGTQADNMADMASKGRSAAPTGARRSVNRYELWIIRAALERGCSGRQIALVLGRSESYISRIKNGKRRTV